MTPKKCKTCGVKFRKKDQRVVVTGCSHAFCTTCMRERCVDAVESFSGGNGAVASKPFNGVTCSCGGEILLEIVESVLESNEFFQYKQQWTKSRITCISCSRAELEDYARSVPCGHKYCCDCVRRMCRLALGDRALVPVRCCRKEFPLEFVRESLQDDEFAAYLQYLKEKDWTSSDLLSDSEYAETVRSLGAKHCPGCGIGVERDFGCIHMTCPIGHQFCFTCLQLWKSCDCPLLPDEEVRHILGEE